MKYLHSGPVTGVLQLFDLLVTSLCFFVADLDYFWQAGSDSSFNFPSIRVEILGLAFFAAFLFAWNRLFFFFGLYNPSTLRREIVEVLKATFAGTVVFLALAWVSGTYFFPARFAATFWIASFAGTVTVRMAVRFFLRTMSLRTRDLRRLLIVGTNRRSVEYAKKLESKPGLAYCITGFVEEGWSGNREFSQSGYPIVSDFRRFKDFIRTNVVDEVMICLPLKSHYESSSEIAKSCEEQGIVVRVLPDLFDLDLSRPRAERIADASVITLRPGAMHGWTLPVKRAIDVLLSSILLAVVSPWFILAPLLIKLTSPGPAFFVQERVGLNKRRFRLYKFRTMVPDAEKIMKDLEQLNELSGPVFKIKIDPRVTTIGRYLRKTSLDEIPQLLNVLKGDMSLVGPRPMSVRDFELFDQDRLRRRFSVRPGITCLWQVKGRNILSFEEWMRLDMEYIDNWSLRLDFKILALTVPAVLRGVGAS